MGDSVDFPKSRGQLDPVSVSLTPPIATLQPDMVTYGVGHQLTANNNTKKPQLGVDGEMMVQQWSCLVGTMFRNDHASHQCKRSLISSSVQ